MNMLAKLKDNMTLRTIITLVKMQSGNKVRVLKAENKRRVALRIILTLLLTGAITYLFITLFGYVSGTFKLSIGYNMLAVILCVSQIISVLGCTSHIIDTLYSNKENTILLAFPCNSTEVFTSKIVLFIITEMRKSLFFVVPFLLGFGISSSAVSWVYWVFLPFAWLILTTYPVLFASIISIPGLYIKRFFTKYPLIYGLAMIGAFALIFWACIVVLGKLPVPLRLIAIYGEFVSKVDKFFATTAPYANIYYLLGLLMFAKRLALSLPVLIAVTIGLVGLTYLAVLPFYYKSVSGAVETVIFRKHIQRVKKNQKVSNKKKPVYFVFLKKEWLTIKRDSASITNIVMVCVLLPVALYILNYTLQTINKNAIGDYLMVAFNLMIIMTLLSSYNANSAKFLSEEGAEFTVLKTVPSDAYKIGFAKLTITFIVNVVAILIFCIELSLATTMSTTNIALLALTVLLGSMSHVFWSAQVDIARPRITEYAEKGDAAISDNANIARSLVIGFILSTLLGVVALLLFMDNFVTGWLRLILIALGIFIARLYLFCVNLKTYFEKLEL